MVADLIHLGADVNAKNKLGKSCLHLSAEKGYVRVLEVRAGFSFLPLELVLCCRTNRFDCVVGFDDQAQDCCQTNYLRSFVPVSGLWRNHSQHSITC